MELQTVFCAWSQLTINNDHFFSSGDGRVGALGYTVTQSVLIVLNKCQSQEIRQPHALDELVNLKKDVFTYFCLCIYVCACVTFFFLGVCVCTHALPV